MPRKRSLSTDLLTQQQGEILKVGFLRKKGHVRRNWLDRWFVLTTEGIYYFKNRLVSNGSRLLGLTIINSARDLCMEIGFFLDLNLLLVWLELRGRCAIKQDLWC